VIEPVRTAEVSDELPILVVDDEPAVRRLFARALARAGHRTIEAADGVEALAWLSAQRASLVVLDSTMPRLGGEGVIRALREREATRTLPIILVTARADLEDRVAGLAAGADDYLAKPVAIDELVARVQSQLRTQGAWTASLERAAEDRRRIASALRVAGSRAHGEEIIPAVANRLRAALGLDAILLASFADDGAVVPLGAAGEWTNRFRPGVALPGVVARQFRRRLAEGLTIRSPADDRPAARDPSLLLPLPGPDGPLGVLALLAPARADPDMLSRRLPLFLDLADMLVTLLASSLHAEEARARSVADVRSVIDQRLFKPHYQPICRLADHVVLGVEALTRFDDGTRPDLLFAEAERLGLGAALEQATIRAAVAGVAKMPPDRLLAINVSPALVQESPELGSLLRGSPHRKLLELSEHVPVADYDALRAAIGRIEPAVAVAVDDAGSGYASLRHILALRPAYVKLDISWVREIDADAARQALVAGIVHFARATGCELIAEGIEREEERQTLIGLNVTYGQGYLLGRPAATPE
jgi:EAL domain-containing protein (putative c-di-GMP-specific phosphodiesterase class I)/CheY-like chemotaxis protein